MKKLLTLLLLTTTLWGCHEAQHSEPKNAVAHSEASDLQHETSAEKLVLNNGAKWKVDISTNNNVKNLQEILKKFNNRNDQTLRAYKKAHEYLQQGIVKMITECKMKGADHEALHKWLEPLVAMVAQLKQASTVTEASSALKAIEAQANLYNQYFEL